MEQRTVTDNSAIIPRKRGEKILSSAFGALRKFLFQFLLPLAAIGPALIGAEKLAELFGFHGGNAQFIRIIMLAVYVVIIFAVLRKGKN